MSNDAKSPLSHSKAPEAPKPVDLYSDIKPISLDKTEKLLSAMNTKILMDLDEMEEVSVL